MRLYFKLTKNTEGVPFDYIHYLIGIFHKWLGENEIHDSISLYSLSSLLGGHLTKNGLEFKNGATWFVSAQDELLCKNLIAGAMNDPAIFCGMKVSDILIKENPKFSNQERFLLASPILVKQFDGKKLVHKTFREVDTNQIMTNTLKSKLTKFGMNKEISVEFDLTYSKAKTKLVKIKNINNRANMCPVILKGDPEAIAFAWNVGIGHSTGSGFGALL